MSKRRISRANRCHAFVYGVVAFLVLFNPVMRSASQQSSGTSELLVSSREALVAALRSGEHKRLLLTPGAYGDIELGKPASNMWIGAADPASPPKLSKITISDSSGLTLENLTVELNAPPHEKYQHILGVAKSQTIRLVGLKLVGVKAPPTAELRGILVEDSADVKITDTSFDGFHRAMVVIRSRDLSLEHNEIGNMSSDGFNFAEAQRVSILRNRFGGFRPTADSHADYIQFWSDGTDKPSADIVVAENVMLKVGSHDEAQGIFLQFEPRMPARNVVVRDNVIVQASPHGISFYNVIDGRIERNIVLSALDSRYKVAVRVIDSSDVALTDNVSMAFGVDNSHNISQSRNLVMDINNKQALRRLLEAIENQLTSSDGRLPISSLAKITEAHRSAGPRATGHR